MSVFNKTVDFDFPATEALGVIGCHALAEGRQEAAAALAKIGMALEGTAITLKLDVSHVFAGLCDTLRAAGKLDEVAQVEAAIKLLKKDLPQIVVVGSIGYHVASARQMDDRYEQLRAKIVDAVGE